MSIATCRPGKQFSMDKFNDYKQLVLQFRYSINERKDYHRRKYSIQTDTKHWLQYGTYKHIVEQSIWKTPEAQLNSLSTSENLPSKGVGLLRKLRKDTRLCRRYRTPTALFYRYNEILFYNMRLYIPGDTFGNSVLHNSHWASPLATWEKWLTRELMVSRYYWKCMRNTINELLSTCSIWPQIMVNNNKPVGYDNKQNRPQ